MKQGDFHARRSKQYPSVYLDHHKTRPSSDHIFEVLSDVVLCTRNDAFEISVVLVKTLSSQIVMELEAKYQSILRRKPQC